MPARFDRNARSWSAGRPGWSYVLWRRKDVELLLRSQSASIRRAYAALTHGGQRSDLARYLILLCRGGVYADLDTVCRRDLDSLLAAYPTSHTVLFVEQTLSAEDVRLMAQCEPIRKGVPELPTRVANFVMAAAPGSSIMAKIIDLTLQRAHLPAIRDYDVIYTTGPDVVTEVVHAADPSEVALIPQPVANAYFRHQCAGTWRNGRDAGLRARP